MSGNDEHIADIVNICKNAKRSTDPSVHNNAIIELADLTKTRSREARKTGIIAIIEIGMITRWPEQTRLAFEKISEILRETDFS